MIVAKKTSPQPSNIMIAEVCQTQLGVVTAVKSYDTQIWVAGQAEHVSTCLEGDRVILIAVNQHYYVIAKILAKDNRPAAYWQVESECVSLAVGESQLGMSPKGQVWLKNSKASIQIAESGAIAVSGEQISQQSQQDFLLETLSGNIFLNYPESE